MPFISEEKRGKNHAVAVIAQATDVLFYPRAMRL